jgi:hypothetical protein
MCNVRTAPSGTCSPSRACRGSPRGAPSQGSAARRSHGRRAVLRVHSRTEPCRLSHGGRGAVKPGQKCDAMWLWLKGALAAQPWLGIAAGRVHAGTTFARPPACPPAKPLPARQRARRQKSLPVPVPVPDRHPRVSGNPPPAKSCLLNPPPTAAGRRGV